MNVPGPLDFGNHHRIESIAHPFNDLRQIVEYPGAVEAIHPHPQRRVPEIRLPHALDEALAGCRLRLDRNGIFEIAAEHIHLTRGLGETRTDFFDMRRKKMHHTLGPQRQLAKRRRCADGERFVKVLRQLHETLRCE